jgi:hypothetical protein
LSYNLKINILYLQGNSSKLRIFLNKKYENNFPAVFEKDDDVILTYKSPISEIDDSEKDKIEINNPEKKFKE